jgi:hypothetical protein
MLKIVLDRKRFKPLVFCDHCSELIEEAHQGNYHWLVDLATGEPFGDGRLWFTHKQCIRAFEQLHAREGLLFFWSELEVLPLYLATNLKVDTAEARRAAELLDSV